MQINQTTSINKTQINMILLSMNETQQILAKHIPTYITEIELQEHRAMTRSQSNIFEILAKYGNNSDGIPVLHYAIKQKDMNAIRVLLDCGASPNAKTFSTDNSKPISALDYAVVYGNLDIINLLIQKGSNVNLPQEDIDNGFLSPIFFAIRSNNHLAIKALISHVNHLSSESLYWAMEYGDLETIKLLVESGAHLNDPVYADSPLLCVAAQQGKQEIVDYLIMQGCDVNHRDRNG